LQHETRSALLFLREFYALYHQILTMYIIFLHAIGGHGLEAIDHGPHHHVLSTAKVATSHVI
jgi:hypothetical protein